MKITLNYDPTTGQVTDNNGAIIVTWMGLQDQQAEPEISVENLVELKKAGFSTDEIVELRKKDIL